MKATRMGKPLKNRKRKFNKSGANPNHKVKDAEMTVENMNGSDVRNEKTKKAKKNKISAMPIDSNNDIDVSEIKFKKAKKNKNKNHIAKMPAEAENVSETKQKKAKKMKFSEMSNEMNESDVGKPQVKKSKINKSVEAEEQTGNEEDNEAVKKLTKNGAYEMGKYKGITEEMFTKYPILKDEEVIKKFKSVSVTSNQKGRIRSQLKQMLRGTSEAMLPDAINIKLQAIIKSDEPNWMKVRVLHNMLKVALGATKSPVKKEKQPVTKENKEKQPLKREEKEKRQKEQNGKDEKPEQKVKGPKRYVVFIGNLPLDISKEKILEHFSDLSDNIKDVRIPKPLENKKSTIAYLEVADELTYELSLSKHHTMLGNKRINVLYSTQKDSKISKSEAKGKAAKLVAMQKSGQLAGSEPLNKKRSARRKKMKQAQKKAQEAAERGV